MAIPPTTLRLFFPAAQGGVAQPKEVFRKKAEGLRTRIQIGIDFSIRISPLQTPTTKIETIFDGWMEQIENHQAALNGCFAEFESLRSDVKKIIPLSSSLEGLALLRRLDRLLERARRKMDQLTSLLENRNYRAALELYKSHVKECEEQVNIEKLRAKFEEAHQSIAGQRSALEGIKGERLHAHIQRLHLKTLEFYAATLSKTAPADALNARIKQAIEELASKEEEEPSPSLPANLPQEKLQVSHQPPRAAGFSWLVSLVWNPYKHLESEKNVFTTLGEQLQAIETEQELLLEKSDRGEEFDFAQNPENRIEATRRAIQTKIDELQQQKKKVRELLYYAEDLLDWADEIRENSVLLKEVTGAPYAPLKKMQGELTQYFKLSKPSIYDLFKCLQTITSTPFAGDFASRFSCRVHEELKGTVGEIGRAFFAQIESQWEENICHSILRGSVGEQQEVKQYLMNEMTRWLYFSEEPVNVKVELLLFILGNDFLDLARAAQDDFSRVLEQYEKARQPFQEETLKVCRELFCDLASCFDRDVMPETLYRYAKSALTIQQAGLTHWKSWATQLFSALRRTGKFPLILSKEEWQKFKDGAEGKPTPSYNITTAAFALWAEDEKIVKEAREALFAEASFKVNPDFKNLAFFLFNVGINHYYYEAIYTKNALEFALKDDLLMLQLKNFFGSSQIELLLYVHCPSQMGQKLEVLNDYRALRRGEKVDIEKLISLIHAIPPQECLENRMIIACLNDIYKRGLFPENFLQGFKQDLPNLFQLVTKN